LYSFGDMVAKIMNWVVLHYVGFVKFRKKSCILGV